MLLFYPGGAIMDRYGRVFVAVPSMVVLGLGFLLLPLTHVTPAIAAVAGLMGLGNGISAGVVMTLGRRRRAGGGADAVPGRLAAVRRPRERGGTADRQRA